VATVLVQAFRALGYTPEGAGGERGSLHHRWDFFFWVSALFLLAAGLASSSTFKKEALYSFETSTTFLLIHGFTLNLLDSEILTEGFKSRSPQTDLKRGTIVVRSFFLLNGARLYFSFSYKKILATGRGGP
jgi:hypothetical protein